ncbi:unnamed protein product [Linum trigynum]|uniref:Uncharacterized protein n=1 Tax=Linum trigynum TaxID=586398 RepID=A0AAV2CZ23_9ROSI
MKEERLRRKKKKKKKKKKLVSKMRTRSRWMKHPQVTSAMKAFHPTAMHFKRRTHLRLFSKPRLNHLRSLLVDAMDVNR